MAYDIELYKRRPRQSWPAKKERSWVAVDARYAIRVLSRIVRRHGLSHLHVFLARGIEERAPEDFRSPHRLVEVMNEDPAFGEEWEVRLRRW